MSRVHNKELGRQMRLARENTRSQSPRFSAVAMARSLGSSQDTVTRWETGEIKPPLDRLIEYCGVLQARGLPDGDALKLLNLGYPTEVKRLLRLGGTSATESERETNMSGAEYGIPITSPEQLRKVYAFDERAYVDESGNVVPDISFELFEGWWKAHANGFLCSSLNNEPFAVIGLFPVKKTWVKDFIRHASGEFELDPGEIARDSSQYWYLSGLSSSFRGRSLHTHLPSVLGYSLARWIESNASALREREIVIVSEGTTAIGSRLLNRLFNFKLESPSDVVRKPRFSKATSLPKVRNLLVGHEFFARVKGLRKRVQSGLLE
ncbi:helix-turn-helix domain-containing protein [Bradyrhizobium sp. 2TAF24]|uniref:helix-turn-helix domain-containing protein n=1 Tax=Bradyrhizobium sp. 2TAF24 TaxID=3233011 RepID=UPI003F8E6852